jgi:hypothetical protein
MALTLGDGVKDLAEQHGRAIYALEQALHIDVEKTVQGWILNSRHRCRRSWGPLEGPRQHSFQVEPSSGPPAHRRSSLVSSLAKT